MEENVPPPPGIIKPSEAFSTVSFFGIKIRRKYFIAGIIILLLIVLVIGGIVFFNKQNASNAPQQPTITPLPSPTSELQPTQPIQQQKKNPNAASGVVTSIGNTSLTIRTTKGVSWTVTVTASTVITGKKNASLQFSSIQINDNLKVDGKIDKKAKTITATTIKDSGSSQQKSSIPTVTP